MKSTDRIGRTTSEHYEVVTDEKIPGLIFSELVDAVSHARDVANESGRVVSIDYVYRNWWNNQRRDFHCYVTPAGTMLESDACRHGIARTAFCAVCTYERENDGPDDAGSEPFTIGGAPSSEELWGEEI